MFWSKNKHGHDARNAASTLSSPIEIIASKNAKAEVLAESKEVSDKLNALLDENHFTIKIYLAAGGK